LTDNEKSINSGFLFHLLKPMTVQMPWECHPDLTESRLKSVAKFLASAGREVLTHYNPELGDDTWSLGCRRNSWWRNRLIAIAGAGDWNWLGIISPTKGFVFRIGNVPMRFYRGKTSRPPASTLSVRHDELRQLRFAFGESEFKELKWRFAVETGLTGEPTEIVFVGHAEDGSVQCFWSIPFDEADFEDVTDIYTPPAAVEIPAPVVAPTQDEKSNQAAT